MRKTWKKLTAYGLCLGMTAGMLAGCGDSKGASESASAGDTKTQSEESKGQAQEGSENVTEPAASGEQVTLTFAASQNWILDVDKDLAKKFEEETGIAIDFQLSPDDQYQTIVKSKLNTGEGPDLFMSYSGTKLKDFNPQKNMVDLSGEEWVGKAGAVGH